MSTLRTFNLQNPDSGTVNIEMDQGGNTLMTGIATVRGAAHFTSTSGSDAVGIGTDITAYKLDVRVTGAETGLRVYNPDTSSNASGILRLGNDDNQNAAFLRLNGSNNTSAVGGAGSLVLGHGLSKNLHLSTAGASRFAVRSDGKISAGTLLDTNNSYEFSIRGADGTGCLYAHGRNHYLSTRSTSHASLTLKKSNSDSDGIDYLQLRDSSNTGKFIINGDGTLQIVDSIKHMGDTDTLISFPANDTITLHTSGSERLRIDSSGHLLHGVTVDEDTSGNGGLRFINSGDIQIDGDQKALVFRSTNNTAQLQSAIEWWNENGAGVQSKIACDRTAVSQAPSDLVFYTSSNVDLGGAGNDGAITERLRITSSGIINSNNYSLNNQGTNTASSVYLGAFAPGSSAYAIATNGAERLRITNIGRMGIGSAAPISKLQVGSHTFNGGNGMHSDDRVGMSNHGQLTGLMLASTYNDGAHPEYGLVFVQGPNTSSYNVWSLSPDGPAKGNSLNFHWDDQATNIHSPGFRKFQMTGEGYFLQPYQPKFRAGRNGNYNPGAGSDIIFNTVSGGGKHNVGGHYNTSNGRFTAPVAGVYTFTAHVIWQGLGSGKNMADCFHIKINGTNVAYSGRRAEYIANETGNNGYYTDFMTYQFTLAANDYVTVNNTFNETVHGNSNYTTFSGHLVG